VGNGGLFKVNLLKKHAFSFPARKALLQALNLAVLFCLLAGVVLGMNLMKGNKAIKELRASFTKKDYEYARELRSKTDLLDHAK
jgi:hypothetical protein